MVTCSPLTTPAQTSSSRIVVASIKVALRVPSRRLLSNREFRKRAAMPTGLLWQISMQISMLSPTISSALTMPHRRIVSAEICAVDEIFPSDSMCSASMLPVTVKMPSTSIEAAEMPFSKLTMPSHSKSAAVIAPRHLRWPSTRVGPAHRSPSTVRLPSTSRLSVRMLPVTSTSPSMSVSLAVRSPSVLRRPSIWSASAVTAAVLREPSTVRVWQVKGSVQRPSPSTET